MRIAFTLNPAEVECTAVRAQGSGGQNVNKVSSAIHLRFDIAASSLPDALKARLLARADARISGDGVIIIKAQQHRSQDMNRADAFDRLQELLAAAAHIPRLRRPTKPTRASKERRLEGKAVRGDIKAARGRVRE